MEKVVKLFIGLVALVIVIVLVGMLYNAIYDVTAVEVETYTVGCEVTQMAYAEEMRFSNSRSHASYKMGVRNDDFAYTFTISENDFARYAKGDIVEVEVTVWEHCNGTITYSYRLLGLYKG